MAGSHTVCSMAARSSSEHSGQGILKRIKLSVMPDNHGQRRVDAGSMVD